MQKIKLCVIFGGVSPEHEVSLRSAETVISSVDPERFELITIGITRDGRWLRCDVPPSMIMDGRWEQDSKNVPAFIAPDRSLGLVELRGGGYMSLHIDCVFPVLHGKNGEDGSVQGLMQLAGIPCVGPGLCASAACMDKSLTKLIAANAGVPQADFVLAGRASGPEEAVKRAEAALGTYPVFVKPAGTGSSVGVSKAANSMELEKALKTAWSFDPIAIVEEFIDGREIEVAVLGNTEPVAPACGEIIPNAAFYDYETKYLSDTAEYGIPADLPESVSNKVRDYALTVFTAMGCRGLSRVDFFVRGDEIIFNEINTIPGFTSISMYPKLFDISGIPNRELVTKLVEFAMEESC